MNRLRTDPKNTAASCRPARVRTASSPLPSACFDPCLALSVNGSFLGAVLNTSRTSLSVVLLLVACGTNGENPNEAVVPSGTTDSVGPGTTVNPDTVSPAVNPTVNPSVNTIAPAPVQPVDPPVSPNVAPTVNPTDTVSPTVSPSDTPTVAPVSPFDPVTPDPMSSEPDSTVAPSGTDGPTDPPPDAGDVPVDETPIARPGLVTSGPNGYWQEGEWTEMGGGNADITVNENDPHQEWLGFGGTFNEAGWKALEILDASERDRAVRLLFDEREGAGLDWGRIPMGSSDYATSRYSYSETADDWEMDHFSIERDKKMLIPYIKAALAFKPDVRLWGSPWSPPAWMKNGNDLNGGSMKNDPQVLQAHALYFARFVEEYANEGLTIDHVQPQNEPGYETRYPSCSWGANDTITGGQTYLGTFVADYLGPTFEARSLNTEIWFGTLSNDKTVDAYLSGFTDAARSRVVGVGLQWNTMNQVAQFAKNLLVMQTEHKCGNYHWLDGFNPDRPPNDHAYGVESWGLIRDWLKAGVHVYMAWNMILDEKGHNLDPQRPWPQNALLYVDQGSATLVLTPTYYVFRHLSYYVDAGAVRLGMSGIDDSLAFKNPDGSIVAVVHNSGGQVRNTTLSAGGKTVQFEIPASGWASVHVPAAGAQ